MAFSEFWGAAPTGLMPSAAKANTSTNNTETNGRRLMHAPPTANKATVRCEQV
jgi:hypothetical protein